MPHGRIVGVLKYWVIVRTIEIENVDQSEKYDRIGWITAYFGPWVSFFISYSRSALI